MDDVYVLHLPQAKDDCRRLTEVFTKYADRAHYKARYYRNLSQVDIDPADLDTLRLIADAVEWCGAAVRQIYGKPSLVADSAFIGCQQRGYAGMEPHADAVKLDCTPNHTPWRSFASCLYLSDGCRGGEIVFPDRKVRIKPSAGMFVSFPSGIDFVHRVEPLTDGTRFTLLAWYTLDESRRMKWPNVK